MENEETETKRNAIEAEIRCLTSSLSESSSGIGDWKVIKIYEARLKGEADPYDYDELAEKRQKARDRINELQAELAEL